MIRYGYKRSRDLAQNFKLAKKGPEITTQVRFWKYYYMLLKKKRGKKVHKRVLINHFGDIAEFNFKYNHQDI